MADKTTFEPEIVDEETDDYFGSKDSISIGKIISLHILRLSSRILNIELKGAGKKEEIIENRKEVFIDGVDFLRSLCYPYFDKEMDKAYEEYKAKLKKSTEEFYKASLEKEAYKRASFSKGKREDIYTFWIDKLKSSAYGYFDKTSPEYDFFIYVKYQLADELFLQLNKLLHRVSYLAEQVYKE